MNRFLNYLTRKLRRDEALDEIKASVDDKLALFRFNIEEAVAEALHECLNEDILGTCQGVVREAVKRKVSAVVAKKVWSSEYEDRFNEIGKRGIEEALKLYD